MDENFQPKPQMVDSWSTCDDGLTWTFRLRDGLEWHDGAPVTAEDCTISPMRWSGLDSMGKKLAQMLQEYRVVDDRTFQIVLKEKHGLMLETPGKPSVGVPFMMPKRYADVESAKQIDGTIGSGPFMFKADEWKPGDKVVYVRNPSTSRAPSRCPAWPAAAWPSSTGSNGSGSRSQVQLDALIKGEVDAVESITHDHLPLLERKPDIRLIVRTAAKNQYSFRMNWTQPPFNDSKIRRR